MKKYLSLILALCLPALLGGCGAVPLPMPESPTPPPAADTEEITYEVSTDPYEQTVTAEDGTTLMVIDFQIPHLEPYANNALIEDPSTPARRSGPWTGSIRCENFDQWQDRALRACLLEGSVRICLRCFKGPYTHFPEELTYTCCTAPLSALPRLLQLSGRCAPGYRVFRMGTMSGQAWLYHLGLTPIPRPSRWQ